MVVVVVVVVKVHISVSHEQPTHTTILVSP